MWAPLLIGSRSGQRGDYAAEFPGRSWRRPRGSRDLLNVNRRSWSRVRVTLIVARRAILRLAGSAARRADDPMVCAHEDRSSCCAFLPRRRGLGIPVAYQSPDVCAPVFPASDRRAAVGARSPARPRRCSSPPWQQYLSTDIPIRWPPSTGGFTYAPVPTTTGTAWRWPRPSSSSSSSRSQISPTRHRKPFDGRAEAGNPRIETSG